MVWKPFFLFIAMNVLFGSLWETFGLTGASTVHYAFAIAGCLFMAIITSYNANQFRPPCPTCGCRGWKTTSLGSRCKRCGFTDMEGEIWAVNTNDNS